MKMLAATILILASISQARTFPQAPKSAPLQAKKPHRSELNKQDLSPLTLKKSPVKLLGKRFETRQIKK